MSFPQAPKVTGLEMLPFPPERQDDSNRNEKGRELGGGVKEKVFVIHSEYHSAIPWLLSSNY